MTDRIVVPSRAELVDYVYGDLERARAQELGQWLVAFADEEVLTFVETVLAEKAEREAMWARVAARPFLARIKRLTAGLKVAAAGSVRGLMLAGMSPGLARLSTMQTPSLTLSMAPGTLDLRLELTREAWVEAVFLDREDVVRPWLALTRFPAGSTSLPGLELEFADGRIEAFVVVSEVASDPSPRDEAWLAERLELASRVDSGVVVCHRRVRIEPKPG